MSVRISVSSPKKSAFHAFVFFLLLLIIIIGVISYKNKRLNPKSNFSLDNLLLGVPSLADVIVEREGYALGYSEEHEQSLWVIYRLTKEEVIANNVARSNDYRFDPEISSGSALPEDYLNSGYDKGHLAPAADMKWSQKAMSDSFYMSNISPQNHDFNNGIWLSLEEWVRRVAIKEEDIYVVTGPIFSSDNKETIGSRNITVPTEFYKVVFDMTPPRKMIGFVIPNKPTENNLIAFVIPVSKIEEKTGLVFFDKLNEDEVKGLKMKIEINQWIDFK